MKTYKKNFKGRGSYTELISLRVTDETLSTLRWYSNDCGYEIYEPIRDFIRDVLIPKLEQAEAEDVDAKIKDNRAEQADKSSSRSILRDNEYTDLISGQGRGVLK